jgi:hypothetical protein
VEPTLELAVEDAFAGTRVTGTGMFVVPGTSGLGVGVGDAIEPDEASAEPPDAAAAVSDAVATTG